MNPRRRKSRKRVARRKKHNARRVNRKKRVARRNPGAGELIIMGNPKRKRNKRRHRSNPARRRYSMKRNAHRGRSYRRRKNPAGINREVLTFALAGSVGAVATRAGVQAALGDKNAGAMGYGANVLAALALGFAGGRFVSPNVGTGLLVGGLISTVLRVAKEQFFASSPLAAQLSLQGLGDADFALSGYINDPFTIPTTSEGADQMTVTPNVYWARPVAPAKGLQGYDTGFLGGRATGVIDRWKSTWG